MASLSLSELPSETLHTPAFDRLSFNLIQANVDSTFVLAITRRCDGHVAVDKLHLVTLRHESSVYIVSSCEAVQCCPNAPQEDLRYTLFNNGSWVVNGSRRLVSGGDLHCTRPPPNIQQPADIQLPLDSRPAPEAKEIALLLDKFFSGFAALLNKTDSSSAIKVAWKGEGKQPCLFDEWKSCASRGEDAISMLPRTTKTTKEEQAKANYLHWLNEVMLACLVYVQTGGKIRHGEPKKSERNSFIAWSRRIPKILQLLSVAGAAALLILTALGNSFFVFADIERKSRENIKTFRKTLWETLEPRLSAIGRLLQGTTAYHRRVLMFNPTAFTRWYQTLQRQKPVANEDICKQLDAEDWVKVGNEVFEERTIGQIFRSLQSSQSTNEEESQARQNNDEPADRWAAAWIQSNEIKLRRAHNEDQTLDIPNENTPHPAHPSRDILMPNIWPTEQPLPLQVTPVQETLANAASQVGSPHHDSDSGYGGSTVFSQFSVATSAMPVLSGDSETNNVPARPIGKHRTALPDEAPPPAALATGSHAHLAVGEALVPYDPAVQNPAYDAIVPNEDSLFLPSRSSIDSGYTSNMGGQQVRGPMSNAGSQQWYHTTSVTSSSGAFLLPSPLSSRLPTQQGTVAAAGKSGGEWTGTIAGQKRPHVEDNPTSKRHRPGAEETTENVGTSEASNVDPESAASTSHAVPQGDVEMGTVSGIADPIQHQELAQELGLSLEEWNSMCSSLPVSSITAYNWDGMFDSIPATSTMAHESITISDELQDVDFSENAATLPAFLSEPQPSGRAPPAEEAET